MSAAGCIGNNLNDNLVLTLMIMGMDSHNDSLESVLSPVDLADPCEHRLG